LDKVPSIDSDEVRGWIAEVNNTGIIVPNLNPTNNGSCAANGAAPFPDTEHCWWTCSNCIRKTDTTECPDRGVWGLTYDDGPGYYTENLLAYLDSQKIKATFFVVGSRVLSFPHTLQSEYTRGHQIAVHTWSHPSLTQLSNSEIIAELGWSRKIIKDVLGVTPNMMRPPFGDIDNRVRAISVAMGLTPVMWTRQSVNASFDTGDFNIHSGLTTSYQVLQNWEYIIGNTTTRENGFIVLSHDLFQESVEMASGYILPDGQAKFDIKPVVSCMNTNYTSADAYIETNNNKTHPPALEAAVSRGDFSTESRPTSTSTPRRSAGVGISIHVFHLALAALTGMVAAVYIL